MQSREWFWNEINKLDWPSCTKKEVHYFKMLMITKGTRWYSHLLNHIPKLLYDLSEAYNPANLPEAIPIATLDEIFYTIIFYGEDSYTFVLENPQVIIDYSRLLKKRPSILKGIPRLDKNGKLR